MMRVILRFEKFISKKYQMGLNCNPRFKSAYDIINQQFRLNEDQAGKFDC